MSAVDGEATATSAKACLIGSTEAPLLPSLLLAERAVAAVTAAGGKSCSVCGEGDCGLEGGGAVGAVYGCSAVTTAAGSNIGVCCGCWRYGHERGGWCGRAFGFCSEWGYDYDYGGGGLSGRLNGGAAIAAAGRGSRDRFRRSYDGGVGELPVGTATSAIAADSATVSTGISTSSVEAAVLTAHHTEKEPEVESLDFRTRQQHRRCLQHGCHNGIFGGRSSGGTGCGR